MKNFKQILALIAEAKLEPGGEDLGKLFGPRGKFRPEKAETKERTARQRMKSLDLVPNPDRPSGMEELLRRHPPEEGPKEPTALSRMRSGELDYRLMPSKPESKNPEPKKPTSKRRKPTIEYDFENKLLGVGYYIDDESEGISFQPHADRLRTNLQALHDEHIESGKKLTERDKGRMANSVVGDHLTSLHQTISNLGSLPSTKKYGQFKIKTVRIEPAYENTKNLHIEFEPLKTHVFARRDLNSLEKYLEKKTGHLFYLDYSDPHMVGTHNNPLIMKTSIFHPHIEDEDEDDDDDDTGDEPEPMIPTNPRSRKPQLV